MTKLSKDKSNQGSIRRKKIALWLNDRKIKIPPDKNFFELNFPAGEITLEADLYWTECKNIHFVLSEDKVQSI
ncbi:MAG: hypothetical protein K9H61_13800 [Bacteroidia bacterium]|nr:hypothetical protein [Bacteroidia bacterium]